VTPTVVSSLLLMITSDLAPHATKRSILPEPRLSNGLVRRGPAKPPYARRRRAPM